jgi:hypothetical protein
LQNEFGVIAPLAGCITRDNGSPPVKIEAQEVGNYGAEPAHAQGYEKLVGYD